MAYATLQDVQARYHLPIDESMEALVTARLQDAEDMIRGRIPDLDERIDQGLLSANTVVRVISDAVIRLVRNPDGYISETDGNYTYQLSFDGGGSDLTITPNEWRDLGLRNKVRVLHVGLELPWESGL